jgi:hypothetical protein
MKYMDEYRDELHSSLVKIRTNIEHAKNPKLNPYTISHQLINLIESLSTNDSNSVALVHISDRIRKFHDFYGWMAKRRSANLGVCSGTFFRSSDYLKIAPKDRSGKRIDKDNEFGVHVEHSIPVKILRNMLIKNINSDSKPEDVFEYLVTYSLCTGFSRTNERNNINEGFGSAHPDFSKDGIAPSPESVKPFIRYSANIKIYSMITGSEVQLTDNLKALNLTTKNIDIFNWDFLERHYKYNACSKARQPDSKLSVWS